MMDGQNNSVQQVAAPTIFLNLETSHSTFACTFAYDLPLPMDGIVTDCKLKAGQSCKK